MERSEQDKLKKDLEALCKKHKITNASFTGSRSDMAFIGFVGLSNEKLASQLFDCTLNIGRLWQHARGMARMILSDFERDQ